MNEQGVIYNLKGPPHQRGGGYLLNGDATANFAYKRKTYVVTGKTVKFCGGPLRMAPKN